jgi:hypothetical protein
LKNPSSTTIGGGFLELSVFLLLAASLLFPSIQIGSDLKLPVEVLLLPALLYIYFLLVCMGSVSPLIVRRIHVLGALLSFSVLVSIIYGSVHFHHLLLTRDYYDAVKVWLPVLVFTIAWEADFDEQAARRFLTVLGIATLLVCLYGWAQFLDLPGSDKLNLYYSGGEHHDIGLKLERRVYSTQGNPNVLGQFLSCALICYVLTFVSKFGSQIGNGMIILAITSTLVLTGSRYALIVSSCGVLLVFGLTLSERKCTLKLISSTFLLAILVWTFMVTQKADKDATSRFQELSHPTDVQSLRDRVDVVWMDALKYFESSIVFGHGPAKAIFTGVFTDSEYLDVLKSYGIIGFGFYFSIHLWVLIQLWKGLRAHRLRGSMVREAFGPDLLLVRLGFVLILAGLAMNIGMATYFNWKFNTFFWLILGLAVRAAYRLEQCYRRLPHRIFDTAFTREFNARPVTHARY